MTTQEILTKEWNIPGVKFPANLCLWGIYRKALTVKAGRRVRMLQRRDKLGRFCR